MAFALWKSRHKQCMTRTQQTGRLANPTLCTVEGILLVPAEGFLYTLVCKIEAGKSIESMNWKRFFGPPCRRILNQIHAQVLLHILHQILSRIPDQNVNHILNQILRVFLVGLLLVDEEGHGRKVR